MKKRVTIGFLLPEINWETYSIIQGSNDTAEANDINVLYFVGKWPGSKDNFSDQSCLIYELPSKINIDGLIVSGSLSLFLSKVEFEKFLNQYNGLPILCISPCYNIQNIHTVDLDHYNNLRTLIKHLLDEHKFRKIAFIRGPENNLIARERLKAYKDTLKEYDLPLKEDWIFQGDNTRQSGSDSIEYFSDHNQLNFDAIVASHDEMAFGVLDELSKRKIKVPEDIAVIGAEYVADSSFAEPNLTTIESTAYQLSSRAVELAIKLIQGDNCPLRTIMPARPLIRNSCGWHFDEFLKETVKYKKHNIAYFHNYFNQSKSKDDLKNKGRGELYPVNFEKILGSFIDEVESQSEEKLLLELYSLITEIIYKNYDINILFNVFADICDYFFKEIKDIDKLKKVTQLIQKAQRLLLIQFERINSNEQLLMDKADYKINHLLEKLLNTYNREKLFEILKNNLIKMGFKEAYISLYADAEQYPSNLSNQIIAYNSKGFDADPEKKREFPTKQLVFDRSPLESQRYLLVVEPLHLRDIQFGFMLLSANLVNCNLYSILPLQISLVLNVTRIFNTFQQHVDVLYQKLEKGTTQISYHISHDLHTGLLNRSEFEKQILDFIENMGADKFPHCLIYLDIDNFKLINDTFGTVAGNDYLRQLAKILKKQTRAIDLIARVGGDRFSIFLPSCPLEKANDIAKKIGHSISTFKYNWQSKMFKTTASIGLTFIENSRVPKNLLSMSEIVCSYAKEAGGNRIEIYYAGESEILKRHSELVMLAQINEALEKKRFVLYCQNILPINNQLNEWEYTEKHYEILIRMLNEDNIIIPPNTFLPVAERYKLMPLVDKWVIEACFKFYIKYFENEGRDVPINCSINLSGASLNDDTFLNYIFEQFDKYKIPTNAVTFEITESVAVENLLQTSNFIKELKRIGCRFALDDFGSGFSSFRYLKHLPVDYLKIDGSFIKNVIISQKDFAIAESINHIGHKLKFLTIAEYVESADILKKIKAIHVDFAQGYHIEKPIPLTNLLSDA